MMRRGLLLVILVLLGAGCGTNSFVGRRFDNFTAYYNTFYNARRAFDRGVKNLIRVDDPIDRQVYLPIFSNPDRASSSKDFEDAVKKSADVLRKHDNSKWVDDALLLIGKSQFYQQNYVGAEQKFQEVIDMGSKLEDEAQFWLARTLIAGSSYEEATRHLQVSLAREGLSTRWASMLHLALGELYVKRADWEAAALELEQGLAKVPDKDVGARAQFLLAQVYETLGRYADAVQAFERVAHFNPHYELSYAARVSAIRIEGIHGDPDRALKQLRSMERDDKNYAYRAEMAYLRGRILQAQGRTNDALYLYHQLLYDPDPTMNYGAVRGRIHYALGELYRDDLRDYVYAAAHFDTAATAVRPTPMNTGSQPSTKNGEINPNLYTREAILDGEEVREIFTGYARVYTTVAQMDSLLELGSLDEPEFEKRILEYRRQRARELEERRRLREQRQIEQRFQQRNTDASLNQTRGDPAGKIIPQHTGSGRNSGFLYHKDPIRLQDGRLNFVNKWGDRPLVPNWRRQEAVSGQHVAAAESGAGEEDLLDEGADLLALPPIDISGIPRDSVSQARVRENRAHARYQLANVLFLSIERPDSAAAWYRMVIDESHDEQVVQQAFYALAEVQRALGDTASANEISRHILEQYPDSEFAERLREQMGLTVEKEEVTDSLALAEAAYTEGYRQWKDGALPEALDRMVSLAGRYPHTDVAPRALLAAGDVYTTWALRDSLDLFAPLPLHVPDSLLLRSGLRVPPGTTPAGALPPGLDNVPAVTDTAPANDAAPRGDGQPVLADPDTHGPDRKKPLPDSPVADSPVADSPVADSPVAGVAVPDSAVSAPIRITDLYRRILNAYGQTPYADPARRRLAALEERRALFADSLAADSLAADSPADSLVLPVTAVRGDSLVLPADTLVNRTRVVSDEQPVSGSPAARNKNQDRNISGARRRLLEEEVREEPPATPLPEPEVYDTVEQMPQVIGGLEQVQQAMKYPEQARKAGVVGPVMVRFIVDEKGAVHEAQVIRSLGAGCDEAAIKAVRLAKFLPGAQRGKQVKVRMSLPLYCKPE